MALQFDDRNTTSVERAELEDHLINLIRKLRRSGLEQEANQLRLALRKLPPETLSRLGAIDSETSMPIELIEQYLPSLVVE
jgi:hypothetical protein